MTPPARAAVLLVNLGAPDSLSLPDIRRFLGELLSDPFLVRLPKFFWRPLLHGIILNTRPQKLTRRYAAIWTPDGPPLKVHMAQTAARLAEVLNARAGASFPPPTVRFALRYGQPSIPSALEALKNTGHSPILLLPLYPHSSSATTETALEAARVWAKNTVPPPELRIVTNYGEHPGYIAALAASVRRFWAEKGAPGGSLLMSFHNLPRAPDGAAYHEACLKTAQALAEALQLDKAGWRISFQSRLGFGKWLKPETEATLVALGKQGLERLDVLCPGFSADCLETLWEIALRGKEIFLTSGGGEFNFIPCLNQEEAWIQALAEMTRDGLSRK